MAKKKDKKGKKAAKVAGVKLPKELLKSGEIVAELVKSPLARQVASAALVAAASAIATRRDDDGKPAAKPTDPKQVGSELAGLVAQGIATFVSGLGQPARDKAKTDESAAAAPAPQSKPKLVR